MNNKPINKDIIADLYINKNMSIRDIAKYYDTTYRNIQRRILSWGLKKNKSKIVSSFNNSFKRTMQEKYGTDHYMKSNKGYKSYKSKLIKSHDVTNIMQLDSTKENRAKTCLKKYGVDHDLKSKDIRNKIKKTCLKKYGVDNPFKSRKLMENAIHSRKMKGHGATISTRFGDIYVRSTLEQKHIAAFDSDSNIFSLEYENIRIEQDNMLYIPDFFINNKYIVEIKPSRLINLRHSDKNNNYLKNEITSNLRKEEIALSYAKTHKLCYRIITEKNNHKNLINDNTPLHIYQHVLSIYGGIFEDNIITNNIINIYINDLNKNIDRRNDGIMIYSDEWEDREIAMKAIIANKLKINNPPIVLRPKQCDVKIISGAKVKQFYDLYHYQGHAPAKYHIATTHKGEIVACMSIRKPTRQKSGDWEITRMACHRSYRIHGIWGCLLKWIKKNNLISGKLISFSDDRLMDGNTYKIMGFEKAGFVEPNYYWVKNGKRHHKSALRKTASEKETTFTESELRTAQGFHKIYDWGKTKWSMII